MLKLWSRARRPTDDGGEAVITGAIANSTHDHSTGREFQNVCIAYITTQSHVIISYKEFKADIN